MQITGQSHHPQRKNSLLAPNEVDKSGFRWGQKLCRSMTIWTPKKKPKKKAWVMNRSRRERDFASVVSALLSAMLFERVAKACNFAGSVFTAIKKNSSIDAIDIERKTWGGGKKPGSGIKWN